MKRLIVCCVIFSCVWAGKLVTNGDFEQALTLGWDDVKSGLNITIDRDTDYDPDPDYETFVSKINDGGYVTVFQITDIYEMPLSEIDFSTNAKLYAYDNDPEAFCGATVQLIYLDDADSILGDTKICARSSQCPWNNTSTTHIIAAPNSNWNAYSFNLSDELTNLPGVNTNDVRKVQVTLMDSIYHC